MSMFWKRTKIKKDPSVPDVEAPDNRVFFSQGYVCINNHISAYGSKICDQCGEDAKEAVIKITEKPSWTSNWSGGDWKWDFTTNPLREYTFHRWPTSTGE